MKYIITTSLLLASLGGYSQCQPKECITPIKSDCIEFCANRNFILNEADSDKLVVLGFDKKSVETILDLRRKYNKIDIANYDQVLKKHETKKLDAVMSAFSEKNLNIEKKKD